MPRVAGAGAITAGAFTAARSMPAVSTAALQSATMVLAASTRATGTMVGTADVTAGGWSALGWRGLIIHIRGGATIRTMDTTTIMASPVHGTTAPILRAITRMFRSATRGGRRFRLADPARPIPPDLPRSTR